MATKNVVTFVNAALDDGEKERIRGVAGISAEFFDDRDAMEERIGEAEVVATTFLTPSILTRATHLRWIQSWAAGPNEVLTPELIDSAIVVTSVKGNGAIPLAEHAIWQMLMLNRNAMHWIRAQADARWDQGAMHGELNGLTCGIIGLGHSGLDVAQKAKAFHMRVVGMRRTGVDTPSVDEMFAPSQLREFLAQSDFVVVTAPITPLTRGMIGKSELRMMKRSAMFVVFSRGGIVDEAALLEALTEGWIAGAALDAFVDEPLPADSPFWRLPNVICTPHAGARTAQTIARGFDIFIENLRRYVEDDPLINVVDKSNWY